MVENGDNQFLCFQSPCKLTTHDLCVAHTNKAGAYSYIISGRMHSLTIISNRDTADEIIVPFIGLDTTHAAVEYCPLNRSHHRRTLGGKFIYAFRETKVCVEICWNKKKILGDADMISK